MTVPADWPYSVQRRFALASADTPDAMSNTMYTPGFYRYVHSPGRELVVTVPPSKAATSDRERMEQGLDVRSCSTVFPLLESQPLAAATTRKKVATRNHNRNRELPVECFPCSHIDATAWRAGLV